MEYVDFGKTGRKVSRLGYGGATAGLRNYLHEFDPQDKEDRKKIIESLQKALELGINYFDTAPGYGNGQSEELFGEGLAGVKHEEIFLATKAPVSTDGPGSIRRSLESSLKRLKRDYVDLVQLHGTSYNENHMESILKEGGTLEEMLQLKKEGLVKFIGFTSEDNNISLYQLIRSGKFDMLQICYNFLFQHPFEPNRPFGSLFEAEKENMGITTMRATTSGWFQKWIKLANPSNSFDYTPALIQFALSNPLVDVVLVGMRSAERVIQNVEICNNADGRIDIEKLCKYYV